MPAVVFLQRGDTSVLLSQARILKSALLCCDSLFTNASNIEAMAGVFDISESLSIEKQYETIIHAMPALNPSADVAPMWDSLQQIKNLSRKKHRSSKEIIALKKSQGRLGKTNTTFRLIVKSLFQSSQLDALKKYFRTKIVFTPVEEINAIEHPTYFVSENLMEAFQNKIKTFKKYDEALLDDGFIFSSKLFEHSDFDAFTIKSFINAIEVKNHFPKILPQNKIPTIVEQLTVVRNFIENYDFKKEKNYNNQDKEKVSLEYGVCNVSTFLKIIQSSHLKSYTMEQNSPVLFFFNRSKKIGKKEKEQEKSSLSAQT